MGRMLSLVVKCGQIVSRVAVRGAIIGQHALIDCLMHNKVRNPQSSDVGAVKAQVLDTCLAALSTLATR